MAKRDVIKYYKEQEKVYFEMVENVKDVDEAFKAGRLEQSVAEQVKTQIQIMRENYEKISYFVYLLNLPIKDKNKKDYIEANEDVAFYLAKRKADEQAMLAESRNALKELKRIIKESLNNE